MIFLATVNLYSAVLIWLILILNNNKAVICEQEKTFEDRMADLVGKFRGTPR